MEDKEISGTLTNSRMKPVHGKRALSLPKKVHIFAIQNEGDGSLQHAIEGVINTVEGITIRLKKQISILFFFVRKCLHILIEQRKR